MQSEIISPFARKCESLTQNVSKAMWTILGFLGCMSDMGIMHRWTGVVDNVRNETRHDTIDTVPLGCHY